MAREFKAARVAVVYLGAVMVGRVARLLRDDQS